MYLFRTLASLGCALHTAYGLAPQALSRLTHLPVITIYLAAGLLSQLFIPGSLHKPLHDLLQPVHDAALGCITLAAGGRSLSKVPSRRGAWLG